MIITNLSYIIKSNDLEFPWIAWLPFATQATQQPLRRIVRYCPSPRFSLRSLRQLRGIRAMLGCGAGRIRCLSFEIREVYTTCHSAIFQLPTKLAEASSRGLPIKSLPPPSRQISCVGILRGYSCSETIHTNGPDSKTISASFWRTCHGHRIPCTVLWNGGDPTNAGADCLRVCMAGLYDSRLHSSHCDVL